MKPAARKNSNTQQEFQAVYPDVKEFVTAGVTPENGRHAIFLGGQPGAGKSSFCKNRHDLLSYAVVNGDEYRRFHPRIQEILQSDPEHYAEQTQTFSNQMVETLIADLSDEGYNLLIEGTLRNPQVQIHTCRGLMAKGYSSELVVIACNAGLAWESTLIRAEMQNAYGQIPRFVPIDTYNYTVRQLPDSLDLIEDTGCFGRISVETRESEILYSSEKGRGRCASAVLWKELSLSEWDRHFPEYEQEFLRRQTKILSDRAQGKEASDTYER